MPFHERGDVRIHYQEAGSGYPLLIIPGGGLNATIGFLSDGAPFNPMTCGPVGPPTGAGGCAVHGVTVRPRGHPGAEEDQ